MLLPRRVPVRVECAEGTTWPKVMYRATARYESTGYTDEFGDYNPGTSYLSGIDVQCYKVMRVTPKGAVVRFYGEDKLIIHTHRNRLACTSIREAVKHLLERRGRQVHILKRQLQRAQEEEKWASLAMQPDGAEVKHRPPMFGEFGLGAALHD